MTAHCEYLRSGGTIALARFRSAPPPQGRGARGREGEIHAYPFLSHRDLNSRT